MQRSVTAAVLACLALIGVGGCGGGGGGGGSLTGLLPGAPTAQLTTSLKDLATDGFVSFGVTVTGVDVETAAGQRIRVFPPADQPGATLDVDLLTLQDAAKILSAADVPAGLYVGVYFSYANAEAMTVDALTPQAPPQDAGGTVHVSLPAPVDLAAGEAGHLDIDFDLETSLTGGLGSFEPVVHCLLRDENVVLPPDILPPQVEDLYGAITALRPAEAAFDLALLGGVPMYSLGTWSDGAQTSLAYPAPIEMGRVTVFLTPETTTLLPDGTTLKGGGADVFAVLAVRSIVQVTGRLHVKRGGIVVADTVTVFPPEPRPEIFEAHGIVSAVNLAAVPQSISLLNQYVIEPYDTNYALTAGATYPIREGGVTQVFLTPETRVYCAGWWETDREAALPVSVLRVGGSVSAKGFWTTAGFTAKVIVIQPQSISGSVVSVGILPGLWVVNVATVDGIPVEKLPGFVNPVTVVQMTPPPLPEPMPLPAEPTGTVTTTGTDPAGTLGGGTTTTTDANVLLYEATLAGGDPTTTTTTTNTTTDATAGGTTTGTVEPGIIAPMPLPEPEPGPGQMLHAYGAFCDPGGAFQAASVQVVYASLWGTAVTGISDLPPAFSLTGDGTFLGLGNPATVRVEVNRETRIIAVSQDPCYFDQPCILNADGTVVAGDVQVLDAAGLIALLKSGQFFSVEARGFMTSSAPPTMSAVSITVMRTAPKYYLGPPIVGALKAGG